MKDKKLRNAVRELCYILGISFIEDPDYGLFESPDISINELNCIFGGDKDKKPITRKEFREFQDILRALFDYLKVKIENPTSEVKIVKREKHDQ